MTVSDTHGTTDWAIAYRRRQGQPQALMLVIADVPTSADVDQVAAALETWARWPMIQARMPVPGQVRLYPRRRFPATIVHQYEQDGEALEESTLHAVRWETLAPEAKVISTPVSGELYAAISRTARAKGWSLREWCVHAFTETVATDNAVAELLAAGAHRPDVAAVAE